ncbi:hypothetical protein NP493_879g01054 [Ridgeia piscesae]|uniref:Uncharacterized protein n=1 Tax=Ridgeia piscesae TaxID=27915 RepID=A0AAD9KMZ1_RIDPI|nr:hypothetical protein NP493_879g01054 [Ridgeia piscesae]
MNRNRKPSESVSRYTLALRELGGDCEYSAAIQLEILLDVFVKGLNLPSVQTKLMLKDNTLTFDNAYKEAVAEDSVNQVQTLGRKKHNANKGTVSSGNAFNSKKSCHRCGGNHQEQKCKYINESCHWCNNTGHKQKSRHNSVAHG